MKLFISWSGTRSHQVAELLSEWFKCVLQAVKPFLSSEDIDRGALWFPKINEQLSEALIGVVCLTRENKDRPWILFESGALAKGQPSNLVCTFLIDLPPADLANPLAAFNATQPEKESLRKLVETVNRSLGTSALDDSTVELVFDKYWPDFQQRFEQILATTPSTTSPPRPQGEMLGEVLETVRFLSIRMSNIEANLMRLATAGTQPSAFGLSAQPSAFGTGAQREAVSMGWRPPTPSVTDGIGAVAESVARANDLSALLAAMGPQSKI